MSTITLSEDALVVLKLRLSRQEVEVTEATRPAYRELAAAGLMIPLHTFVKGDESAYRFTEEGWELRETLLDGLAPSSHPSSHGESPAPRD